jgi:hypothetical protein
LERSEAAFEKEKKKINNWESLGRLRAFPSEILKTSNLNMDRY